MGCRYAVALRVILVKAMNENGSKALFLTRPSVVANKTIEMGRLHFGGYFLVDTSFLFGLKRVENYSIQVSASLNRVSDVLDALYICRLLVSEGYTGNR